MSTPNPHVYEAALDLLMRARLDLFRQKMFLVLASRAQLPPEPRIFLDAAGACERATVPLTGPRRREGRRFYIEPQISVPCPHERRDSVLIVIDGGAPDLSIPLVWSPLDGVVEPGRGQVLITLSPNGLFGL